MNVSRAKVLTKFVDLFQFHQVNSHHLNGLRHKIVQLLVGGEEAFGGGGGRLPVSRFDKVDDFLVGRLGVGTVGLHRAFFAFLEENCQKRKQGMFVDSDLVDRKFTRRRRRCRRRRCRGAGGSSAGRKRRLGGGSGVRGRSGYLRAG